MKDIVIIGAGGFGREVAMLIEDINKIEKTYNLIGFVDDREDLIGRQINGYAVLGNLEWLLDKKLYIAIGIGEPNTKSIIVNKLKDSNNRYPNLIHPNAIVSEQVSLGKGCIITAGTIITVNIIIKDFVTVNLDTTIGHDVTLHDFVTVLPSVNISGNVEIKESTMIGTGSAIIQGLTIGSNTTVGAGSVVIRNIPDNCVSVGNPAKVIKEK